MAKLGNEELMFRPGESQEGNVFALEDMRKKRKEKEEKEKELREKIKLEQEAARERFSDLRNAVNERYRKNISEDLSGEFAEHDLEVLDNAIELAIRRGLPMEKILRVEMAAVWHDATKTDPVPEEFKDIKHYSLAMHGKTAAEMVPEIFTDEYLKSIGVEDDFEGARKDVAQAILEHMGPRPGFMNGVLEYFNRKMKEKGHEGVDYPEASGDISEILLTADMGSLASKKGREKIFKLRMGKENFRNEDFEVAKEYNDLGIALNPGEAALLSAYDSAYQARDMMSREEYREWLDGLIEESKSLEFSYGKDKERISWHTASGKRSQYEEAMRLRRARERIMA